MLMNVALIGIVKSIAENLIFLREIIQKIIFTAYLKVGA